jgi:hypothetical protein
MWMIGGIIGTPDVISALGKSFKVKTMGVMENFVGCKIIDTIDKDGVWIHQPTSQELKGNLQIYHWRNNKNLQDTLCSKDTYHPS